MCKNDNYFMNLALELAKKGAGFTSPNPMVGAVIVKDDKIIGKGYHKRYGMPHAEVEAINDANQDINNNAKDQIKDATMYVTLEPCNHYGKTPPCAEAILKAGIKKVVVASKDPNPNVKGGGISYLRENNIEVIQGVCEKEANKLNESFIKFIKTKKPFVILKCAATLDGYIATDKFDSKWITNSKSRQSAHMIRQSVDAIMVGIGTVKNDDPSLTTRLDNINCSDLNCSDSARIILDSNLSISLDAKVLNLKSNADTIIVTSQFACKKKIKKIKEKKAKILFSELKHKQIDLNYLMTILGEQNITNLLIEGGSKVLYSAMQSGIVDKIYFYYAPKILGGDNGIPIFAGNGAGLIKDCIKVKDIKFHQFDNDFLVEGYLN